MLRGTIGATRLHECGKCFGRWLDAATFEQICRNSERQAAVLGSARVLAGGPVAMAPVRSVRCPECRDLRRRMNFARCSGVVVVVCRNHGTWFDRNELHRIVLFIRNGGLDLSRDRQKLELAMERRRIEAMRRESCGTLTQPRVGVAQSDLLSLAVGAAGGLLSWWLKK